MMGKLDELRRTGAATAAESMGAGVPSILGVSAPGPAPVPARLQGIAKAKDVALIPLAKIGPDPDQPREEFDPEALQRLADSLRERGQLQPIRVRWDEGRGQYVIVCGERRWRAAEMAGLPTMSCIIMEGAIEPSELLALQLIENCVREDLKPIEQAKAFRTLMDRNGWSTRDLAAKLAIVQPQIVRTLALLDLPDTIQEKVEQGALAPATAYEISKVEDPAAQAELAARVVAEGLSRQETVAEVRRAAGRPARAKGRGVGKGKKLTPRVFRSSTARVTVELLKKAAGAEAMLELLREAVRALEAELGAGDQAAA
jgi:ParB family transcriptional regulator, chromosome partitioning protein